MGGIEEGTSGGGVEEEDKVKIGEKEREKTNGRGK